VNGVKQADVTTSLIADSVRDLLKNTMGTERQLSSDSNCDECWRELLKSGFGFVSLPVGSGGDGDFFDAMVLSVELGKGLCRAPFPDAIAGWRFLTRLDSSLIEKFEGDIVYPLTSSMSSSRLDSAYAGWVGCWRRMWLSPETIRTGEIDEIHMGEWVVSARNSKLSGLGMYECDPERVSGFPITWTTGEQGAWSVLTKRHRLELAVLRAATCYGAAVMLLGETCGYLSQRHQFGGPLSGKQAIQHELADRAIGLLSARELLLDATQATSNDPIPGEVDALDVESVGRVLAIVTAECELSASSCLHFFGGYGFSAEGVASSTVPYVKVGAVGVTSAIAEAKTLVSEIAL